MDYVILLWHSLSLPYNYFVRVTALDCGQNLVSAKHLEDEMDRI